MAVRTVHVASEAVEGVAPTTWYNAQVESITIKNMQAREIPRETTGTRITAYTSRRGGRHSEISVRLRPRYDQLGFWLKPMMGAPTTTAVAGAAGAFDHVFKPGGTSLPSMAIRMFYESGWRQALGVKIDSFKFAHDAKGMPVVDIKAFGRWATEIVAPTPVAIVDPGWIQPIEGPHAAITYNAVSYTDLLTMAFEVQNNLEVRHTIQVGADAKKMSLGDLIATFDFEALMSAYAGSLLEQAEGDGLLDAVIYTATDTTSSIGTGTPVNPRVVISAPRPLTDDGDIAITNTDSDQTVSGELGYDSGLASNISFTIRNTNAAAVYAGS